MSAVSSLEQPPSPPSTESSYQQSIDVIVAALRRDAQFASASYITLLEEAEKIYERREASKIRLDAERMRAASAALAPTAMQLPSINPGMIQSLPTHSLAGTSSISTFTPHMHLHSFSITLIQLCRQLYIDQKYVRAFMHAWCTSQPAECMQCICVAGSAFYGHRLKPSDALIHGTRRATAYVRESKATRICSNQKTGLMLRQYFFKRQHVRYCVDACTFERPRT
jgi:hypothetical protein